MKIKCFVVFLIISLSSCNPGPASKASPKGSLFIIGGGSRPPEMIQEMVSLSGVDSGGYIVIIPLASIEPDTSFYYAAKQFRDIGIDSIFDIRRGNAETREKTLKQIENAGMVYIPGGSQGRFMDSVRNTGIGEAIRIAYEKGAMIAGTSAGAAVQSKWMITGDQKKYPVYTGDFPSIEADNIILEEGLGLTGDIIIDQHFIKRQRLNRLISVSIENPETVGVGIDESTAIHLKDNYATVYGESQVVVLRNPEYVEKNEADLLGVKRMDLSIYLPGERFQIR